MPSDIVVRGVPAKVHRAFKASVIAQGYNLHSAILWLAKQVADGKIKLPKK